MKSSKELTDSFFSDLKKYNQTNFKTILNADLSYQDATVHKAFSSVITRYFIFREKHPEIKEDEFRLLYFVVSLDLVAAYFADYPNTSTDYLVAFQLHLKRYVKERRIELGQEMEDVNNEQTTSISDIGLGTDNSVQVEQQQESIPVAI